MSTAIEETLGAVLSSTALQHLQRGGPLNLGSLIKDPRAAAALVRKYKASKEHQVKAHGAMLQALMTHEALHHAESRKRPTTLVSIFLDNGGGGVPSVTSSAVATVQRPYSGRHWAITMFETMAYFNATAPFNRAIDGWRITQLNIGGVDLAVSPSTASVSYSATPPAAAAIGIPAATFDPLATDRLSSRALFAPWTAKSMVFTPTDTFNVQGWNGNSVNSSLIILMKMISNPCGERYRGKHVAPKYWSRAGGSW